MPVNNNCIKIFNCQTTTGYIVKQHYYDKLINNEALFVKGNLVWFGVGDSLFKYDFNAKKHSFIVKLKSAITTINGYGDTLWVGCRNSICIINNNKLVWNLNLSKNGFSQVQAIAVFSKNEAYFSNCNGFYKVSLSNGVVKLDNLYPNICFRDIYIFKKFLFITSYGNGCFVFDGFKFNKLNVDKGNYLLKSHSIQIDINENVWISTNNGIFQTTFKQVKDYIDGKINKVNYNYFNDENGIQNSEFNGGCYPSSVQLADGNIYFPSINGLVNFNPSEVELPKLSDSVFIDKFDINGSVISVSNNIELNPNSEILNIYFSSPYWYNSYNVSYQYKLEGYNSSFVDVFDGKQHISFTNLTAGNYRLIIKKNAGLRGEVGVKVIYITVNKNFYETWWFVAILIILVILIIIKLVKIYNKHLVYKNSILEKKVNERTHELAEINAYLLKANEQLIESKKKQNRSINLKRKLIAILTHDIITPLKFISMVARNSKNIKSEIEYKNLLNDIDHTSLRLYENAQNILNWIKYQSSNIKVQKTNVPLYVIVDDAAELLKDIVESKSSVIINNIDPDYFLFTDKNILSIVIQNLVSNAVKHNTSVEIEISSELDIQNGLSKIIIKDNGKGISNETLLLIKDIIERHSTYTITENSTGSGLGFIIVTELLFALDSSFAVHSDMNGTIITILLKL
jgi:signal transduction histidine kinase